MRRLVVIILSALLALGLAAGSAGASTWGTQGSTLTATISANKQVVVTPRGGDDAAALTLVDDTWSGDGSAGMRLENAGSTLVIARSAAVTLLNVGDGVGADVDRPVTITLRGSATAWSLALSVDATHPGSTVTFAPGDGGEAINLGGRNLDVEGARSFSVATDIRNGGRLDTQTAYVSLARDTRIDAEYLETGAVLGGGHALTVDGEWFIDGSASGLESVAVSGLATLNNELSVTETATFGTLAVEPRAPRSIAAAATTVRGTTSSAEVQIAASGVDAFSDNAADLTVLGAARFSGAVNLGTLQVIGGSTTLGANVSTVGAQTYDGDVLIALGTNPLTLAAGTGAKVTFGSNVSARWPAVAGADGYTAEIEPSGRTCSSTRALTCSFGAVAAARSHRFSVSAASADTGAAADGVAGTRRISVRRGSRTPLTKVVSAPTRTGRRVWSDRGPCSIRKTLLIAPKRRGTCTVTLRLTTGPSAGWTGRAIVTVR